MTPRQQDCVALTGHTGPASLETRMQTIQVLYSSTFLRNSDLESGLSLLDANCKLGGSRIPDQYFLLDNVVFQKLQNPEESTCSPPQFTKALWRSTVTLH